MLNEHSDYELLAKRYPRYFRLERGASISTKKGDENILVYHLYDQEMEQENLPVFGIFAGVHGIEAIGVKILFHFIDHLLAQTAWNSTVQTLLRRVKIIGIPIVNPSGFIAGSRSNGNGVDLMRNAPVESEQQLLFIGGQKFSNKLPWFRGENEFETENKEVIRVVQDLLWKAPFALSLDIHSGFGVEDFLWTPYAKRTGYPPTWEEYLALKAVLDTTLKHHVYKYEPQSMNYCTSGDLWDYLYDLSIEKKASGSLFLPLTLEVGSWVWVKKSPGSAFHLRSFFNPVHPHRERRVLRRHLPLLNLLTQAVANYQGIYPKMCDPESQFLKVGTR